MQYQIDIDYTNKENYLNTLFDYLMDKGDCSVYIRTASRWEPHVIEKITSEISNYCDTHNICYIFEHIKLKSIQTAPQKPKQFVSYKRTKVHRRPIKSDQ